MRSSLALVALFGLGASAVPVADSTHHGPGGYGGNGGSGGQVPFKFPLANGFPNIQVPSSALTAIEKQAHGTLPNGALPTKVADATATTLQLIAFNEIFEVAFFTSLLQNVTRGGGNWDIGSKAAKSIVVNALKAVQAQEELHAIGANGILSSAGRTTIEPCEYVFPSDNFDSAIALASTFTDVVLGTLQDALNNFGTDGDTELLALIGSVIGQEGEQNGFYRTLGFNKIPSQLPFLTRSAGPFAFSALNQMFVVPGSCPNSNVIDLPIFEPLTVVSKVTAPKDQTVQFSFKGNGTSAQDYASYSVVYINQQNTPVVEPLQNIKVSGGVVTFQAAFPGAKNLMNGLTIAAVTDSAGPFADADAVAAATKFGPGLIDIN